MKKIVISLFALAAVSGSALAERNYDLRDVQPFKGGVVQSDVRALGVVDADAAEGKVVYHGRYGTTTDPLEVRRWDEKNSN